MQRYFALTLALIALSVFAVPGSAQELDGPPAPPQVDEQSESTSVQQDVEVAQQEKRVEQTVERKQLIKILKDSLADMEVEVDLLTEEISDEKAQAVALSGDDYWIGVVCEKFDESQQQELGLKRSGLVVKQVVEESPAAKAGFEVHDVLVSFDDKDVTDAEALSKAITETKDKQVYAYVVRDGEDVKLEVQPAKRQVLHVGDNLLLHHALQFHDDEDLILHKVKEKPGQSLSFQVVRPGVIASDVVTDDLLKIVSPQEIEVIKLEGKIKAAIQGDGDRKILLHTDDGQLHERIIRKIHSHAADGQDNASDASRYATRIELTHKDGEDPRYVIVIDGKKYEIKGDNFDQVPEAVREHVKFFKDGKMMFGVDDAKGDLLHRFQFRRDDDDDAHDDGDKRDKHVIRRAFSYRVAGQDDGDDEERIELRIEKQNEKPAKIVVKKGDQTWIVDENSLHDLPKDVRGKIRIWKSKDGNLSLDGEGKNGFQFRQGDKGVFRVFGGTGDGDFKFKPKGEFRFELPKSGSKRIEIDKEFDGRFKLEDGQFNRLRLAPGSRYLLSPRSASRASDGDGDLADKIDALNKEIKALRKAIEKLADEIND
ncbi:MAG: PDZ domain-containing protein [Pirellulales bacterium]|nr:PDZ domain-containing protein [Pirellulales bacterium]